MKVIDLFCGCGGMSFGFEAAGHSIVAAYDAWNAAVETYNANAHAHKAEILDLSNVDVALAKMADIDCDMIIGGPPCQDFSSAGRRKEGERANLTLSFANIVINKKPKFFVMENVARARNSAAYAEARAALKRAGYGVTEIVLDASYCGVPQTRKRFFAIGKTGAADNFLSDNLQSAQSDRPMTVRDYFGEDLDISHYYRHPRTYARRGIYSVDEPAATVRGVNRPLPKGYAGHANDAALMSPTLRPLTTQERARVQTFPKDFIWLGTKTRQEQMIGNAVPVNLAKFVAQAITLHAA